MDLYGKVLLSLLSHFSLNVKTFILLQAYGETTLKPQTSSLVASAEQLELQSNDSLDNDTCDKTQDGLNHVKNIQVSKHSIFQVFYLLRIIFIYRGPGHSKSNNSTTFLLKHFWTFLKCVFENDFTWISCLNEAFFFCVYLNNFDMLSTRKNNVLKCLWSENIVVSFLVLINN